MSELSNLSKGHNLVSGREYNPKSGEWAIVCEIGLVAHQLQNSSPPLFDHSKVDLLNPTTVAVGSFLVLSDVGAKTGKVFRAIFTNPAHKNLDMVGLPATRGNLASAIDMAPDAPTAGIPTGVEKLHHPIGGGGREPTDEPVGKNGLALVRKEA